MFRKRAAPAVVEIKDRHVKDEKGVVAGRGSSKKVAHSVSEIVFTLSGFHCLPENFRRGSSPGYETLAGFFSASFGGGRKSGGEGGRLLELRVDSSQTRPKRQFV